MGAVNADISREALEFAVFCIENLALRTGKTPEEIYRMLTRQSDILDGYILPCWEVLHTQDRNYIMDDLIEMMRERKLTV